MNLRQAAGDDFEGRSYDVFISHASEDKDDVARPLARALEALDLSVWYDEHELKVGASLRRSIDAGIRNSRFGLVILSPSFFAKGWTNYELDGLVTLSVSGEQVLLPIWHKVTAEDVSSYSASLADRVAIDTGSTPIHTIARQIADAISHRRHHDGYAPPSTGQ